MRMRIGITTIVVAILLSTASTGTALTLAEYQPFMDCVADPSTCTGYKGWRSLSLSGTIPDTIATLTGVTSLELDGNAITGVIPVAIASLTALGWLNLASNTISGTLPGAIASMTALTNLNLENNAISGTLPNALASLTALTHLKLNSNSITGTMPDALGSMTALEWLCVAAPRRCLRDAPPRLISTSSRAHPAAA
jgi:Leucine-rich repeat (LRR) protein